MIGGDKIRNMKVAMTPHKKTTLFVLAAAFGLSCAVGYRLNYGFSGYKSIMFSLLDFALFLLVVYVLYVRLKSIKSFSSNEVEYFNKANIEGSKFARIILGGWKSCFVITFSAWVIFAIVRYPGIQAGGVYFQIQQFMGLDTMARNLSSIVYEGHFISGHHPVLLTVIFGLFIKFGVLIGNPDIGMFFLALFICVVNALCWSYIFELLKEYFYTKVLMILYLIFTLNPMVMSFNSYILKDSIFASVLALYSILLFRILNNRTVNRHDFKLTMILSVVLPFIKNQGIYIVIIVSIIFILIERTNRKYWIACLVVPIIVFNVLFQGIVMPALKIAPGGKQEMLSIIFQTTARTIIENEQIKDTEDYQIIQKILPIDDWSVYKSDISDPIKSHYNQKSTRDDLVDYFITWVKLGVKYPRSYMHAFLEQTYGYYNVEYVTDNWIFEPCDIHISEKWDVINKSYFTSVVNNTNNFLKFLTENSRFRWFFSVPMGFWIICISCFLYNGKVKELLWLIPVGLQWLICLVSPVNGSGRYGMLIYELSFFAIAWCINSYIKDNQTAIG